MIGILIILAVSWLLLHFITKDSLLILGWIPTKKRLLEFIIGLLAVVVIRLVFLYLDTQVKSIGWAQNPNIQISEILAAIWYHLKSALTEDLVFRGALLYILIKKIGLQKGVIISAIVFGVYHWFSYDMLGSRWVPMLYVFFMTGFAGYVWGYTFAVSKSILMPLGFHLGVNLINAAFFESAPYGELLFKQVSQIQLSEWNTFYYAVFTGLAPSLLTLLFVKFLAKYKLIGALENQ